MTLPFTSYRKLALGCLVAFAAFTLGESAPASSNEPRDAVISNAATQAGKPGPNPLNKLAVTLRQTGSSPPTVRATVTNKNYFPVTIVAYQSPLDQLALQLGMLSITPAGSKTPLELRVVKVKRVWPPPEGSLIVIQPGASATNDMVIQEPTVPMDKLDRKATVVFSGDWIAVWPRPRNQISKSEIENASESAFQAPLNTRP
ncbi:hypothetical protein HRG_011144 [Hirsutella rhossiliensis]|uniref:Uncharacterized protein n=1 Tax=Hirsutella rhossiliensis TaxID=111463 RepID=A0A9P8MLU1_9HYPO|nr:uncharacterized protein HRG_11144 [Hirsutella rhossiliensis]KAH0957653.1 hypothetical protein HRG_11144 [Hirsutella rhossiliensis]